MNVHAIAVLGSLVFHVDASDPPTHPLPTNPCMSENDFVAKLPTSAPVRLPGHPERFQLGGQIYAHVGNGWCPS